MIWGHLAIKYGSLENQGTGPKGDTCIMCKYEEGTRGQRKELLRAEVKQLPKEKAQVPTHRGTRELYHSSELKRQLRFFSSPSTIPVALHMQTMCFCACTFRGCKSPRHFNILSVGAHVSVNVSSLATLNLDEGIPSP